MSKKQAIKGQPIKRLISKEEMLGLKLEGRTYQYIANKAGVSRQCIQQIISPPPYIRRYIVKKYNGFCLNCGIYVGSNGHIHHKGTEEEDYEDRENLVLLCPSCHRKEHKGEIWKYDSERKLECNRLLVEYCLAHPELSLGEVGKIYNISRQRVSVILMDANKACR